jgi:hypothetical protein
MISSEYISLLRISDYAPLTIKSAGSNVGLEPDKTLGALAGTLFEDSNRR